MPVIPLEDNYTDVVGKSQRGLRLSDTELARQAGLSASELGHFKGGGFDAVLFTSSSTVRNLVGIAGKPHAFTVIGVIGPQTAKTAAEFGLRVDVTAPKPSMTALVDAMAEYGATLRDAAVGAGEPVRRPSERRRGARRRLR